MCFLFGIFTCIEDSTPFKSADGQHDFTFVWKSGMHGGTVDSTLDEKPTVEVLHRATEKFMTPHKLYDTGIIFILH